MIPFQDPTLLFTNAGMVQFKERFTGQAGGAYTRAVTAQKCVRAGGKHNDLENVGRTARHHTLFEMLGNFSFGDYFKTQAIELAWRFVTQEMQLDPSRLIVTVFGGENGLPADEEAEALWRQAGVESARIQRLGMKDNFWSMGESGPCGPCSEIHYHQGDHLPCPAAVCEGVACDCDRYLEIWNLVFMQFERLSDGTLKVLPKPSIDTGMGLERACAVVNGLMSNYDTDLLLPLIHKAAALAGKSYGGSHSDDDVAMRVLADHARATAFLIADGVFPSNEGRGYVLRRIMRRAIRHGERMGLHEPFFHHMTAAVVQLMQEIYPALHEGQNSIDQWTRAEEETFRRTLQTGLKLLNQHIANYRAAGPATALFSGEWAFELYDTYGFPLDLTALILAEQNIHVDEVAFERALSEQRARAGKFHHGGGNAQQEADKALAAQAGAVRFIGYELGEAQMSGEPVVPGETDWSIVPTSADIQARYYVTQSYQGRRIGMIRAQVKAVQRHLEGEQSSIVLDPTPFYGESGGQIGDRQGLMLSLSGELLGTLGNTLKALENTPVSHFTLTPGAVVNVGDQVLVAYDAAWRRQIRAHHSATHLLQRALKEVLGEHVSQAGSLVEGERLRFDFTHFKGLSSEELDQVERHVNERIAQAKPIVTEVKAFADAKQAGALALFGEKYGDTVRVLTICDSKEFCGGTHAANSGDIGAFRIVKEESIASGTRRIEGAALWAAERVDAERLGALQSYAEALAGGEISELKWISESLKGLEAGAFKVPPRPQLLEIEPALRRQALKLLTQLPSLKAAERDALASHPLMRLPLLHTCSQLLTLKEAQARELQAQRRDQLGHYVEELAARLHSEPGAAWLTAQVDDYEMKDLRTLSEKLRTRIGSGVIVLAGAYGGKAALIVSVSSDLTQKISAKLLIQTLAPVIGGSGGGKPDFAQAGGVDTQQIPAALEKAALLISQIIHSQA